MTESVKSSLLPMLSSRDKLIDWLHGLVNRLNNPTSQFTTGDIQNARQEIMILATILIYKIRVELHKCICRIKRAKKYQPIWQGDPRYITCQLITQIIEKLSAENTNHTLTELLEKFARENPDIKITRFQKVLNQKLAEALIRENPSVLSFLNTRDLVLLLLGKIIYRGA
ncbi:MAG: hypothetical protein V2A63_04175 [Patescibacteria group bacterium]